MRAAAETGVRIPDDVSLVGYDDLQFSALANPPLTTISQPVKDMAAAAAELLLRRMRGEDAENPPLFGAAPYRAANGKKSERGDRMKKVFIVGSINMDLVIASDRLPLMGETIHGRDFFTNPGGKGANQAVAVQKSGRRRALLRLRRQRRFRGYPYRRAQSLRRRYALCHAGGRPQRRGGHHRRERR